MSIPNYGGGEVVSAKDYDRLLDVTESFVSYAYGKAGTTSDLEAGIWTEAGMFVKGRLALLEVENEQH